MSKYYVYFQAPNHPEVKSEIASIGDVIDGFWVNDKYQVTRLSDCRFWIPPSRILYVEKITEATHD